MPSLDIYKELLGAKTIGAANKNNSDAMMEATWFSDINTKTCYLYEWRKRPNDRNDCFKVPNH